MLGVFPFKTTDFQGSKVSLKVVWGPVACCLKANKQARLVERKEKK